MVSSGYNLVINRNKKMIGYLFAFNRVYKTKLDRATTNAKYENMPLKVRRKL